MAMITIRIKRPHGDIFSILILKILGRILRDALKKFRLSVQWEREVGIRGVKNMLFSMYWKVIRSKNIVKSC